MTSPVRGLISPSLPPILKPYCKTIDSTFPFSSKGVSVTNSYSPNEGPIFEAHLIPPYLWSLALTLYLLVRLRSMLQLSFTTSPSSLFHSSFANAATVILFSSLINVAVGDLPSAFMWKSIANWPSLVA